MKEIICAGFGGQGVLTAGMLIIHAGMKRGMQVLFYPSYGAEMRGGTANCSVKLSDRAIASPVIRQADIVIAMNTPAIEKFEGMIKPGGLLLVNSSLTSEREYRKDIRRVSVPVTDIALEAGNPKGANIAMLGAFAQASDVFPPKVLLYEINGYFEGRGKNFPANTVCFENGAKYVREHT